MNAQDVSKRGQFNSEAGIALGSTHICIGAICIICGIILLVAGCVNYDHTINHCGGIWSGVFYILTGTFGILAGKKEKKSLVIVFLIFSILSALMAWVTLGYGAAAVNNARDDIIFIFDLKYHPCSDTAHTIGKACGAMMIVFGLVEFVISVVSASFCCPGCCDRSSTVFPASSGYYPPPGYATTNQAIQQPGAGPNGAKPMNGMQGNNWAMVGQGGQGQTYQGQAVQGQPDQGQAVGQGYYGQMQPRQGQGDQMQPPQGHSPQGQQVQGQYGQMIQGQANQAPQGQAASSSIPTQSLPGNSNAPTEAAPPAPGQTTENHHDPHIDSAQPQSFQAPPQPYQDPPLSNQTAPQAYQAPPQAYQAPPQSHQAPPQGYNAPPQGYQGPPQMYQAPPQMYPAPTKPN